MNKEEAMQHALGYAAGREDASGIKTAEPGTVPGFMAFAEAYAEGWRAYNAQERFMMTNCRDAYETWQATNGQTIFRDGQPAVIAQATLDMSEAPGARVSDSVEHIT